jgi:hypothetical protein
MPYTLPFTNGSKVRLNRIEKQFAYCAFTLPIGLCQTTGIKEYKIYDVLLCQSDIKEGKYTHSFNDYNIIWLDFPEECISNNVDMSIRDFSEFGVPPLILIRKHRPN